jgi:hypothetical protein
MGFCRDGNTFTANSIFHCFRSGPLKNSMSISLPEIFDTVAVNVTSVGEFTILSLLK